MNIFFYLVFRYHRLSVLNKKTIDLQDKKIFTLETKYQDEHKISTNLESEVANKNKEIELLNDTIKQQNKKITKLKLFKIIGIPAVIAVPILTTLLVLK
jgi:septal ring factor EnvC (AmiA/AmiB activator)